MENLGRDFIIKGAWDDDASAFLITLTYRETDRVIARGQSLAEALDSAAIVTRQTEDELALKLRDAGHGED